MGTHRRILVTGVLLAMTAMVPMTGPALAQLTGVQLLDSTVGGVLGVLSPAPAAAATSGITFSGYSWAVKSSGAGLMGPGPNVFSNSPENVWVDAAGQLHLRITQRDGQWRSAEVILDRSLGYGTYSFSVASPLGQLDPNVVLGMFTWSDNPAENHREIDVEIARWGDTAGPTNAQYVVQPWYGANNMKRFVQPATEASVHSFNWARKQVTFASRTASNAVIADWRYTGRDVPRAGDERTRINLWLRDGLAPTDGAEVEVVLSNFTFTR